MVEKSGVIPEFRRIDSVFAFTTIRHQVEKVRGIDVMTTQSSFVCHQFANILTDESSLRDELVCHDTPTAIACFENRELELLAKDFKIIKIM